MILQVCSGVNDPEKVIKGLECCIRGEDACTSNCPYFKEAPIIDGRCITAVQADALALLKEMEEEIKEKNARIWQLLCEKEK